MDTKKEADDETKAILASKEAGETKGRTIHLTAVNSSNVLLGAGIVSLPWSFSVTGFGMSIILLFITAVASGYTFSLLVNLAEMTGTSTYQDTAKVAFGRVGYILLGVILVAGNLTNLSAYIIFIVDNVSKLLIRIFDYNGIDELQSHFWGSRAFLCAVPLLLVVIPLSSMKDIGYFSKWAILSILSVAFTLVLFFTRLATFNIQRTPNAFSFIGSDFLQGFGTIIFSYQIHDATHAIYDTLHNKSQERWNKVMFWTFSSCTVPLLIIGTVGYAIFTGHSQGNIFENFCNDDDLANVGRFIFVMNVLLTCPPCIYVIRQVVVRTFLQERKLNTFWNILISVVASIIAYGISFSTECLSIILEITGVTTSIPMMFILPGLLALRIKPGRVLSLGNMPNILVLVFGAILVVAGIGNIIVEISRGEIRCYEGHEPIYCYKNGSYGNETDTIHTGQWHTIF